jgi:hypothetical protein
MAHSARLKPAPRRPGSSPSPVARALSVRLSKWRAFGAGLSLAGLLSACATPSPRALVTGAEQALAQPEGFTGVRYASDDLVAAERIRKDLETGLKTSAVGHLNVLVLSGGGAHGAFGAGALTGWSETGQRPQFDVVTGISTGALIATFAFLGPDYDPMLAEAYTNGKTRNLLAPSNLWGSLFPGQAHDHPLKNLIAPYITEALLDRIAQEHKKGRRLLIGTTNLDSQQSIIWDMGAIALQTGADRRALFVDVLAASASVPGVFAPVMIPARYGDFSFREMHVDGGATAAFFLLPESLLQGPLPAGVQRRATVWVLINGQAGPSYARTPLHPMGVATRTLETAIKAANRTSLTLITSVAERNRIGLRYAAIPGDARIGDMLDFSPAGMKATFDLGQTLARDGLLWSEQVPNR